MKRFKDVYKRVKESNNLFEDVDLVEEYMLTLNEMTEQQKEEYQYEIEELDKIRNEKGLPKHLENFIYIKSFEENFVELIELNTKVNQNKEVAYLTDIKDIIETLEDAKDVLNIKHMYELERRESDYMMMDRVIKEITEKTYTTENDINDF